MTLIAKRAALFVVALLMLTLTAATVSAQPSAQPYIEINNRNISITRTEQPQIVVQFGNRGQATLTNVRVRCFWNGDIRFVAGSAQNGPFASSQFVPPSVGNPPTVFYPAVGGAGISLFTVDLFFASGTGAYADSGALLNATGFLSQ
ncbi:MAG: hypothetical protein HC828_16745, partial [Blastochloris sp.]|nr:hypothetical protein [Blastochloris sp.]